MNLFPFANLAPKTEDERFMLEALKEAWKAFKAKEVPIGAVLVHKGKIISRGYNQVEMLKDATAHAEMLAITAGAASLENWRLADTILYSTVEPCAMCAGALLLSRVPVLVWGTEDVRHGANGSWLNIFDKPHPTHQIEIRKGVLANPCAFLLRDFFQKRRQENKETNDGTPFNVDHN